MKLKEELKVQREKLEKQRHMLRAEREEIRSELKKQFEELSESLCRIRELETQTEKEEEEEEMSSIYVLEPPTKGKVIVSTTHGSIDIKLLMIRTFKPVIPSRRIRLMIPVFLVQGGDPTGSGTGGESIYGDVFTNEFHSRLRFNHRGIVAMANESLPNTNGSQFFFTLDKSDWLDKKHMILGKVTGDSIYYLLRLGEVDTSKDDRPLDHAPKILSVEVLWNPFEDIVPRVLAKTSQPVDEVKEPPKKPVKKLNLLSFGEEAEEEEKELAVVKQNIKSSHDVLNDPRILKAEPTNKEKNAPKSKEVLSVTNEELRANQGEYEAKLQELSEKLSSKTSQMERLKENLDEKSNDLEKQKRHEEDVTTKLNQDITILKEEIENLKKRRNSLILHVDNLTLELDKTRKSVTEASTSVQKENTKRKKLESTIALMKRQSMSLADELK